MSSAPAASPEPTLSGSNVAQGPDGVMQDGTSDVPAYSAAPDTRQSTGASRFRKMMGRIATRQSTSEPRRFEAGDLNASKTRELGRKKSNGASLGRLASRALRVSPAGFSWFA
jgi:hypothetical protein